MRSFGAYTVTLGKSLPISLPGATSALAALRIYNFSPWTLEIVISGQSPIIAPQQRDIIYIDKSWNWDGSFTVMPLADVTIGQLSSIIRIVGFGAGEQIPGTDPAVLPFGVGSSLLITDWIISQTAAPQGDLLIANTRTGQSIRITAADGNIFFGDFVGGAQSSLSYGQAPLDAITLATPSSGAANGIVLQTWNGAAIIDPLSMGSTPISAGLANFDQIGQLHATGPENLNHGNQETGFVGFEFVAAAANNFGSCGVNFKTTMQNIPSSIILTAVNSANVQNTFARFITAQGFFFSIEATAAGDCFWYGTYQTVGN